ncbi:hypothetical protein WKI71_36660 [Streptomyces sp. MS1.AVA.1]|uniref:Uncharacterized protein n=1 Tax=Streptomyces machairae TaxID=3134109 RepID=A0ABU8UUI4_9ACTN
MIRIIRTATLRSLQADAAQTAEARQEVVAQAAEVENWHARYNEAHAAYERAFKDLGQAHADRFQAERDRDTARNELAQTKADTDQQMAELREDFAKIRAAAADTENGETVRAALAYHVLRDMYADAWNQGLLPKRPFDLIAALLDFKTAEQPAAAPAV